ncbi:unnamed protein product [Orchesella dallaii]|uniref:F-box domain-containing protein n=1 Tax=Orchesella dallaii TaxID=48710 RepID=A0ABP1S843_9HEXA
MKLKGILQNMPDFKSSRAEIQQFPYALPPEVWEKVFSNLSPNDFLAVINTCHEWRELLRPQRTATLLPLVLPILLNTIDLNLHDVLTWREVSHGAKFVVEEFWKSVFSSSQTHFDTLSKQCWSSVHEDPELRFEKAQNLLEKVTCCYTFQDYFGIQDFLSHVNPRSLNPAKSVMHTQLMSNYIGLTLAEPSPNNEMEAVELDFQKQTQLSLLNSQFGYNISALSINLTHYTIINCWAVHFVGLLEHVPNLKILRLSGYVAYSEDKRLLAKKFPKLNHLELLDIENYREDRKTKVSLTRQLISRYGPQLLSLICGENLLFHVDRKVPNSGLPNLHLLLFKNINCGALNLLSQMDWPLESLQLQVNEGEDHYVRLGNFFKAVNKFGPTLNHLQLAVHLDQLVGQVLLNQVNRMTMTVCPSVFKLTTEYSNICTSWWWTLVQAKFPNLVELEVHMDHASKWDMIFPKMAFEKMSKLERIFISCATPPRGFPHRQRITRRSIKQGKRVRIAATTVITVGRFAKNVTGLRERKKHNCLIV